MKALEEKIVTEGTVLPGNVLKVGSFLNQQMDSDFIMGTMGTWRNLLICRTVQDTEGAGNRRNNNIRSNFGHSDSVHSRSNGPYKSLGL